MGNGQRGKQVALPAPTPRVDGRVVRRAFHAEIVAVIAGVPVLIPLLVRFVMTIFVADQIAQGKSVVAGGVVYARPGAAPGMFEQVARTMQAAGQFRQLVRVTAPKAANGITIAVVPLAPAGGKSAQLIAPGADVPGFRDQLDAGERRILRQGLEEWRARIEAAFLAAENGSEIEAETVDPHLPGPVAQAVHDQPQHLGMGDIDGVAAAAVIDIETSVAGQQLVIAEVVDALVAQRGAEMIAFAGMVVDDVENDFEAGVVKAADHFAEFVRAARAEIGGVRAEEIQAVIAPVIGQALARQIELTDEGVYWHQFDGGYSQRLQVSDDLRPGEAGESSPQPFRNIGVQLGKTLDVTFIDDGLRPGRQRPAPDRRRPAIAGHHRLGHVLRIVARVGGEIEIGMAELITEVGRIPAELSRQRPGVRVEQEFRRIETVAGMGRVRAVHAIAVAGPRLQTGDVTVPDAVGLFRQENPVDRFRPAFVVQAEFHRLGMSRVQGESRALAVETGAHYVGVAGFDAFTWPRHRLPAWRNNTVASGGNVTTTECGWPSHGIAWLQTPPPLPWPLPPYTSASELRHSR